MMSVFCRKASSRIFQPPDTVEARRRDEVGNGTIHIPVIRSLTVVQSPVHAGVIKEATAFPRAARSEVCKLS